MGRIGRIRTPGAIVVALAVAVLLALVPASGASPGTDLAKPGKGHHAKVLKATIRRTKYGIPHIRAKNIKSLAAGYAFAFAQDDICTIANEYVTVSGERSKYFGADGTWTFSGNGTEYSNVIADTYFGWAKRQGFVEQSLSKPPPIGPKRGVRRGVKGYVAGYNAYLRKVGGADGIKDPACRGAAWVRKIKPIDVYRRFFQLGILASSGAVLDGIVNASPVSTTAAAAADALRDKRLENGNALDRLQPDLGSNAYALGGDATTNGRGMVLGNPHFPWHGSERLYQSQLQIPGKLNVEGGSLYGVPLINIGWTKGLAWSHTVATAWRFTPFRLQLVPGDPHSYIVDGQTKAMEKTDVTFQVKTPSGLQPQTRSIYSTEYGPMIDDLVGIPLPWTEGSGFALKDVNLTNFRYINHFYDNNLAQSVAEYDRIERKYQGIPWVNSIAADSKGNAYYSMQGAIPAVSDAQGAECNVLAPVYSTLGLPVLDGSRSACDWEDQPGAVAPGTFAPDEVPTLIRRDYVTNGNDSHWLSNPEQPLTGFARIIGIENAERSFRTRLGLRQVQQRIDGTDGLPGKGFDLKSLERVALGDRVYLGELWRDPLVQFCDSVPGGTLVGSSGPVQLGDACDVLRNWNLRDDLDSSGALLFRRFATNLLDNFPSVPTGLEGAISVGAGTLFTTPYDNADPVNTPSGLATANPLVGAALADAITDLQGAGIPIDAGLAGHQYTERGGERISVPGGPHALGNFNVITAPWDAEQGYGDIVHGSSFIMAARFTGGKCPVKAGTFVTYGESENQSSPHASDYTKAFAQKKWNDAPFCSRDLRKKTLSTKRLSIRVKRKHGR